LERAPRPRRRSASTGAAAGVVTSAAAPPAGGRALAAEKSCLALAMASSLAQELEQRKNKTVAKSFEPGAQGVK
jgi:hypothetical protein